MYLRILYIDRIGVVHDITAILAKRRINIVSMEVEKNKIFLECQSVSGQQCKECIAELSCITGIQRIDEISAMPSKERAEQLDAILTSVHDGILSVNSDGLIAQYNPAAARILNLPVKKAVGKPLGAALFKNLLIQETLQTGCQYHNREVYIDGGNSYCVVSTIPLKNNVNLSQLRMLINDSIVQIHFFSRYYDPIKKKTKKILFSSIL